MNTIFYEINYSASANVLLSNFLSLVHFPFIRNDLGNIRDAEILIEQSFSDFGDADALMLLTTENGKVSVFIEAKVKSYQRKSWNVYEEFNKFQEGIKTKVDSSNLFTQLYHKVRLVGGLAKGGLSQLKTGIEFPGSSSKSLRRIGNNPVVLKAIEKLSEYLIKTYYAAILSDTPTNLEYFFTKQLPRKFAVVYPGWDVNSFGYISWSDIESFCHKQKLENSLRVFKFNEGQIYRQ